MNEIYKLNEDLQSVLAITKSDRRNIKNTLKYFKSNLEYDRDIFYNLCFCLCSPQTTFKSNLQVVNSLKIAGFYLYDLEIETVKKIVKPVRFYNIKAENLMKAKTAFDSIVLPLIRSDISNKLKRLYLIKNIKGFGFKTASHFLRNCGVTDLAIIDTHILKFLKQEAIKTKITTKKYLEMEIELEQIASEYNLPLAGLDIWLWKSYSNTDWKNYIY
jgi:N-glycosylase/DNA lyase